MKNKKHISVVTVTSGTRQRELLRACQSVADQQSDAVSEHIILLDGYHQERPVRNLLSDYEGLVKIIPMERPNEDDGGTGRGSVYPRISRLFNAGAEQASGSLISYLDDDNTFEPEHLAILEQEGRACDVVAHNSGRNILHADGSPYKRKSFPWSPSKEIGDRVYRILASRNVWPEGGNQLYDQVDIEFDSWESSTIMSDKDPTFVIDQSVWLLDKSVVLEAGFPTVYSAEQISKNICPDDLFLERLVQSGVAVSSVRVATVNYYLGGISNI